MNDLSADKVCAVDSQRPIPLGHEQRAALLLAHSGTVLTEMGDEALSGAGITGRDYSIMAILQGDGPGSQLELAKLLGKAPAIVVACVDDLEARGLVERTRDPADRRRSRVTLTKAGEKALARADALADQTLADMFSGLDGDELRQLHGLLAKGLRLGLPAFPER